jgi:predicted CXXCH cytochrome family protein
MSWFLVLLMVATTQATDSRPDSIVVLTPPPQVSIGIDNMHVVGSTSAAAIKVTMNGREQGYALVSDSFFHYHLDYGYGLNEVTLTPLATDSQTVTGPTSSLEILYGPVVSRQLQRVYPTHQFHGTAPPTQCITCHQAYSENSDGDPNEGTCLDCHADVKRQFKAHTEADDRACVGCHQLDRNLVSKTAGPEGNPCFRCHKDKVVEYTQEYIHGPVAGGGCVICHNSHGSQYESNLRSPQRILCFSCHEDLDHELSREFVHEPFAEGDCGGCHDPHSTANKWVLVKNSEEICLSCHGEMGVLEDHGHPYNVAPKKPLRVDLELTERGVLECLSCHSPHATDAAHLLRLPGRFNCVACHDDKG